MDCRKLTTLRRAAWAAAALIGFSGTPSNAQDRAVDFIAPDEVQVQPPSHCLSAGEAELARLVNEYRAANGLPPVALSRSLTEVAKSHVFDLETNDPVVRNATGTRACSLHSWSDEGPWSATCYTRDNAEARAMWSKPRELTGDLYCGNGFENAYWSSAPVTAINSLAAWKRSPAHNDLILERGQWRGARWPAMGVGLLGNHAVLWFGDRRDALGTVDRCEEQRGPFLQSILKSCPIDLGEVALVGGAGRNP